MTLTSTVPMNKEYEAPLSGADPGGRAPVHEFDVNNPKGLRGCMPVRGDGQRGADTLPLRPLKTGGSEDPRNRAPAHGQWCSCGLKP